MDKYKDLKEWFKIRDEDANFFQSLVLKRDKTIYELNKILDKAAFKQTDFVYIKKRACKNLVFYDLVVEYVSQAKRTYNFSTTTLFPLGISINQEQPIINVLSTKSNAKVILIKVEILDKHSRSYRSYMYDKQNNSTRGITSSELEVYTEWLRIDDLIIKEKKKKKK